MLTHQCRGALAGVQCLLINVEEREREVRFCGLEVTLEDLSILATLKVAHPVKMHPS
jgi:hypothetical protein